MAISEYFLIIEIIGIIVFCINGFLLAVKKELDLLGGIIICTLTALGGGITRDLLTGTPLFIFEHSYPLIVVLAVFFICFFIYRIFYKNKGLKNKKILNQLFDISDSIGVVFFALTGSFVALNADLHIIAVALISLITATGGGALRDIAVGKIPTLFKEEFYGTVAILMGVLMYLEYHYLEVSNSIMLLNMLLGLFLRYTLLHTKLNSPKI